MDIEYKWDDKIGPILYIQIYSKKVGLCLCHRRKDRSVKFFGLEHYFCSRCLGILIGSFLGFFFRFIYTSFPLFFALIMMVPLIIDGFSQLVTLRESTNAIRLITGFLFGFGMTITALFWI